MKSFLAFSVAVAVGLISMGSTCDRVTAAPNPVIVQSLENIKTRLLSGADTDRATLAGELRLTIPKSRRWGATKDIPCTLFDSVETSYATLLQPGTQAVVNIYSRNCEYTYLAVFEHMPEGSWSYIDTIALWSKLSEPKIDLATLIEEGTKEIVASGCTEDSGTGVTQTDLIILKLFQGGLQTIFDAPAHVVYAIPGPSKTARGIDQSQESEFTFISPVGEEPRSSLKQILEKQVVRYHGLTTVRWWLHIWMPETRRFQGVPTAPAPTKP